MIGAAPFRSFFYLLATGAATLALGPPETYFTQLALWFEIAASLN